MARSKSLRFPVIALLLMTFAGCANMDGREQRTLSGGAIGAAGGAAVGFLVGGSAAAGAILGGAAGAAIGFLTGKQTVNLDD